MGLRNPAHNQFQCCFKIKQLVGWVSFLDPPLPLPEHLHCIWRLPEGDRDYSKRWRLIKGMFSKRYLKAGGKEGTRNQSRLRKREAAIWQRRYWEHQIRDDEDFETHFDHIHFNPVKHAHVRQP